LTGATIFPERIDTMSIFFSVNVPDLRAVTTFNRISLNIADILHRLETGLRINYGKDDPSGLLAREIMRADIKGIQVAQKNTGQANSLLAMAETGMASISQMLIGDPANSDDNGLIGLIYDDRTTGAMKKEQINDILNMIDSVARSTSFNGKSILNGTLDYHTSGVDSHLISKLNISRAEIPSSQGLAVNIEVLKGAEKGTLKLNQASIGDEAVHLQIQGGTDGQKTDVFLAAGSDAQAIVDTINASTSRSGVTARIEQGLTNNQLLVSSIGENNDLVFTVKDSATGSHSVAMANAGLGDRSKITISQNGSTFLIAYNTDSNGTPTAADIRSLLKTGVVGTDVFEGVAGDLKAFRDTFGVELAAGETGVGQVSDAYWQGTLGNANSGSGLQFFGSSFVGTTGTTGANEVLILGGGTPNLDLWAMRNGDTLSIQLKTDANGNVTTTAQELVDYMNGLSAADTGGISASVLRPAGQSYTGLAAANDNPGYGLVAAGLVTLTPFNDPAYKMVDSTTKGAVRIVLESAKEGSGQIISVTDAEGHLAVVNKKGAIAATDRGTDIQVAVNGRAASADGLNIQFSSDTLNMTAQLSETLKKGDTVRFNVMSGGATFQLGKDVRSDLQLRIGIPSVDSVHIGGASGFLDELRQLDLDTDAGKAKAYNIVNEAVKQIATLRGSIGAVQKHILDANSAALDIQLTSVTEAEADISNADTAYESSQLSRAELLAQTAMNSILYSRSYASYVVSSLM
jgi:flagellin